MILNLSYGQSKKDSFLKFDGTFKLQKDKYILKGSKGGELQMDTINVKIENNIAYVKDNSPCKIISEPIKITTDKNKNNLNKTKSDCARQEDCPSGCCMCIGAVRICCGDGGTRGFCLGVWGCP